MSHECWVEAERDNEWRRVYRAECRECAWVSPWYDNQDDAEIDASEHRISP